MINLILGVKVKSQAFLNCSCNRVVSYAYYEYVMLTMVDIDRSYMACRSSTKIQSRKSGVRIKNGSFWLLHADSVLIL